MSSAQLMPVGFWHPPLLLMRRIALREETYRGAWSSPWGGPTFPQNAFKIMNILWVAQIIWQVIRLFIKCRGYWAGFLLSCTFTYLFNIITVKYGFLFWYRNRKTHESRRIGEGGKRHLFDWVWGTYQSLVKLERLSSDDRMKNFNIIQFLWGERLVQSIRWWQLLKVGIGAVDGCLPLIGLRSVD